MKSAILIDGYNLGLAKGTGIATYARNLSHAVHETGRRVELLYELPCGLGGRGQFQQESFFKDIAEGREPFSIPRLVVEVPLSAFRRRTTLVPISSDEAPAELRARLPYFDAVLQWTNLFEAAVAKFEAFGLFTRISIPDPPAVVHWTYPLPIRIENTKNIYTIHDLVPLQFPELTRDRRHEELLDRLVREADHIVTVSESSRRDICNRFGAPEDRVTNTYQSVAIPDHLAGRNENEVREEVERGHDIRWKDYFLYYGAIEPKKNVLRLIEAFLHSGVKAPLLIVGGMGWLAGSERQRFDGYIAAEPLRIRRIGHVPLPQLVSLIRGAKAVLFPSLVEGFGLPVLESMLLKTPVLASNRGSIPEVAGKAALLVDPYDIGAMSAAIQRLDADAGLRESLRAAGSQQALLFSARHYEQRLDALYSRIEGGTAERSQRQPGQ